MAEVYSSISSFWDQYTVPKKSAKQALGWLRALRAPCKGSQATSGNADLGHVSNHENPTARGDIDNSTSNFICTFKPFFM